MNWFTQLFAKEKLATPHSMKKFLIVGLGNIGADYVNTRHNTSSKAEPIYFSSPIPT